MLTLHDELTIRQNLFNAPERYKVVTVNCVGAMGKGIALECRERHTQLYNDYRELCKAGDISIGTLTTYRDEEVILFPTKVHFKDPTQVSYVIAGLYPLVELAETLEGGIALPPLGMANGWLKKWQRVEVWQALKEIIHPLQAEVVMYLPTALLTEAQQVFNQK
ncbi:hypothetical protein pEaSNUABM11_00224 [Erwinia phage pEa_SNUABM_11]|nr:hypothetical protein pEaSNUABM11_00224 [Erwinia phage pEa_SNUABM_11]